MQRGEKADSRIDTASGLRAGLKAARAGMPAAERARADTCIADRLRIWVDHWLVRRIAAGHDRHVLAGFWPIGAEPDLRALLAGWAGRRGLLLALPIVEQRAAPLAFRQWTPDAAMLAGDFGIPEPQGRVTLLPDVVLVPLLGFTDEADRIGYGGGFYDRTLAALRDCGHAATAIGVAYACCRLDPGVHSPEPHDVRLHAVVHEKGWVPAEP